MLRNGKPRIARRAIRWSAVNGRSSGGQTTSEVAASTGYSLLWMRTLVQRFNAVGDRRHHHPGAVQRRLLNDEQQAELAHALEGAAPDGGLWSCAKVAIGRPVCAAGSICNASAIAHWYRVHVMPMLRRRPLLKNHRAPGTSGAPEGRCGSLDHG